MDTEQQEERMDVLEEAIRHLEGRIGDIARMLDKVIGMLAMDTRFMEGIGLGDHTVNHKGKNHMCDVCKDLKEEFV